MIVWIRQILFLGGISFEGLTFDVFADNDAYLTKLYGDYMKLPPEDKRRTHSISAIYLGDDLEACLR